MFFFNFKIILELKKSIKGELYEVDEIKEVDELEGFPNSQNIDLLQVIFTALLRFDPSFSNFRQKSS